jgi:putative intracellular protease/amidase
MKWRLLLVTSLLMFSIVFSNPPVVSTLDVPDVSDVKVLIVLMDGFGWNYFDARDRLEAMGVNVTTVAHSLDYNVSSCVNRPPRPIMVDLLLNDMTNETVSQFDCLLVTSGGHWAGMIASDTVMNFISNAHHLGLIVASICTGTRMVSEANDIVNGSKVVSYTLSSPQMIEAGATPVWGVEAVADNQIITGGRGGGPTGGGYLEAPTSEVCGEIIRTVLGLSRVTSLTLTPSSGPIGTNFSFTAAVDNLNDTLMDILSTNITEVTAHIYGYGNRTLIDTTELTDVDLDGNFTGHFIGLEEGEYVVDIEVEDSNSTLEVARELETFEVAVVTNTTTTSTSTTTAIGLTNGSFDIVLISTVVGGSIVIVVLVVALIRKK